MRWIVSRSLRFRWLVLFAATALMAFGVAQIPTAKVDVFPEFAPPRVEIQTIALGNSSNEVEELITIPIEEQLTGLPGLEELRSKSVSQLSAIELIFERGTDEVRARQLVQERIAQVTPTLPTWASPPWMMPPLSATSRIMKIGVSSDEVNLIEMSNIAYWKIRQQLMRVPGVASVDIYGERLQQRHVQVDPRKLVQNGVSLERVMETTAEAVDAGVLQYTKSFVVGSGGFIESANGQRMNIEHVQPVVGPSQLAKVPIEERNGRTLRLEDVGRVVEAHIPLWGEGVVNGGNGLLLIVQKFRGANTMEVTRGVEEAVDEMRPGLPGLQMDTTIFRPATFIEQSIDNLTSALLLGVLLVAVVISAFLFEWRTAFISLIAIPLSLIAAILVLDLTETTINVMVLAGLVVAIGVVVDDAIIDVENIVRRLRQARAAGSSRSTFGIVLDCLGRGAQRDHLRDRDQRRGDRAGLLPPGPVGVLLPAARPLLWPGSAGLDAGRAHGHAGALPAASLSRAAPAAGVTAAAGAEARLWRDPGADHPQAESGDRHRRHLHARRALIYPTLGNQLLPNFKERDFLMHWLTEPSTSAPEEKRISIRACRDLREIPGVRNCGSHIGQALLSDEIYGVYFGENWISVGEDVDYDQTLDAIHRTVEGYPGLYRDVQTYLRERIKEVLTGTSDSIVVRIFGPDLDVLREKADEVAETISDVDGAVDVAPDFAEDLPHIEVRAAPRRGAAVWAEAGRRAPAVLNPAGERRGQRHLLWRQGLRRARLEHSFGAQQSHRRREAPD